MVVYWFYMGIYSVLLLFINCLLWFRMIVMVEIVVRVSYDVFIRIIDCRLYLIKFFMKSENLFCYL